MTIFCPTALSGIPILSIARYFVSAGSFAEWTVLPFACLWSDDDDDEEEEEEENDDGGAGDAPSSVILALTAARGTPMRSILSYFPGSLPSSPLPPFFDLSSDEVTEAGACGSALAWPFEVLLALP